MNFLNYKLISIALVSSVILCYVQENAAAVVRKNEHILEDAILLPISKRIRHVRVLRNINKLSSSVTPPIIDLVLSTEAQRRSSESNNSGEIVFWENDIKASSASTPVPRTEQSITFDNHSSISLELEVKSSDSKSLNVVHFSESPSRSNIQRAIPVENVKEIVVIDENKDRAFEESEGSSKLWIYSNAICILLVVGVSIFLIYYPKKDRRKACKDSSESSTSSSSASSMA